MDGARLLRAAAADGQRLPDATGLALPRAPIDSFDVIYGSSAGSINASYTAAGQAQLRAPLYVVAGQGGIIDPRRALRGRPPFRLAELFNSLFHAHPHAAQVLRSRPPGDRKQGFRGARRRVLGRLLRGVPETVVEMLYERPALYNAEAADLQTIEGTDLPGRVAQLSPPDDARHTSQIEARPERVLHSIAIGVQTTYRALAATEPPAPAYAMRRAA